MATEILEVVKDIAVKNELSSIDMLRSMQVLGDVADKFVNQFLPPPKYPLSTMLKHGQSKSTLGSEARLIGTVPSPAQTHQARAR